MKLTTTQRLFASKKGKSKEVMGEKEVSNIPPIERGLKQHA